MILVITHLDDLKERFPVRIEVAKAAGRLGAAHGVGRMTVSADPCLERR